MRHHHEAFPVPTVPVRVQVAMAVVNELGPACEHERFASDKARAAYDNACNVLTQYLTGEHGFRDDDEGKKILMVVSARRPARRRKPVAKKRGRK